MMVSDVCQRDQHEMCMERFKPGWCSCYCHQEAEALREDDLAPMTPEQVAWVRAQRRTGRG